MYRMTYEKAGQYYRAMMLHVSAIAQIALADIDRIGLRLPNKINPTFAEFLDLNANRLQCYDDDPIYIDRFDCYPALPIDGNHDHIQYICFYKAGKP